jgi:hypothetical protein
LRFTFSATKFNYCARICQAVVFVAQIENFRFDIFESCGTVIPALNVGLRNSLGVARDFT